MHLLEIKNITKSYQDSLVIKNITMNIEEGEIVSILGPSGVGKTTLFNIISAIETADDGTVCFEGENVTGENGHYSYMQQKNLLLEHKTVLDNAALPMILKGAHKKQARAKAFGYFESFGLLGCENKYPQQLSGGMKQRVSFLRAFLYTSKMMLLDEPFSALDAITKSELHHWYLNIIKKYNITTLFVTHDIDEAIHLSDRIYIITGIPGQITEEILVNPNLKKDDYNLRNEFLEVKRKIIIALGR